MDVPIELHGDRTGNCVRVSIALEEARLAYVASRVDLSRGEQREARHLHLNPAGKVPTIVDRSCEPPLVLSQNDRTCQRRLA
jgi:GST-like protein